MTDLTMNSPWPARFMAWVHQRFALPNALLFFILYITAAVVARAAAGGEIALGGLDVVACVVTWSFFLLLRVLTSTRTMNWTARTTRPACCKAA